MTPQEAIAEALIARGWTTNPQWTGYHLMQLVDVHDVGDEALAALTAAGYTAVPTGLVDAARMVVKGRRRMTFPSPVDVDRLATQLARLDGQEGADGT